MRIAIDLDNTLIDYRALLDELGRGAVPPGTPRGKASLRAALVVADGNDHRWQKLQAEAYGVHIDRAPPFAGALAFVDDARRAGHDVYVVSHKTSHSTFDPSVELREAALRWLERTGFMSEERIPRERVAFFDDRHAKVRAVTELGCDWLIDDLREVLTAPGLPKALVRIWFTQEEHRENDAAIIACARWQEITTLLVLATDLGVAPTSPLRVALGKEPSRVAPLEPGGNGKLRVVVDANGSRRVVKAYARDGRQRAATEHRALRWMRAAGIAGVPEPLFIDEEAEIGVTSYLEGRRPDTSDRPDRIADLCADFILRLVAARPDISAFGPASDARLTLSDYPRAIERRLLDVADATLAPALAARAKRAIAAFEERVARARLPIESSLDPLERVPSPSDFGAHNMRIDRQNCASFFDFEYFGWDDPAKLMADFLCSVAHQLPASSRARFCDRLARGLPGGENALRRLEAIRDLVQLEWILIVARRVTGATHAREMLLRLEAS